MLKAFQRAWQIVLFVLLSPTAWALEVVVTDQHGKAVANAYVGVPEGTANPAGKPPAVMDQVDVRFVPHVLAVDQGQSVIFPNSDNIRHHVYSFSEPKRFEIKLYAGVPEEPVVFGEAGVVVLGCNIHDAMLGYIFVSPWPSYGVTDESGTLRFSETPEKIAVWHPWLENINAPIMFEVDDKETMTVTLDLIAPQPIKKFSRFRNRYDD
ncbi:hypothetical protein A3742_08300 [Oleiphilus sp. HI0071]|jgi:plastocyanin|uniref:methylamine utilization protein n=1 Tax=unclassified Oleiphilus TaxID=2631174 RepID=UPI0007C228E7|nr:MULTISPECIES: methylamine utilization protein [unclassified Oleiphilus]KZY72552.1 hypothetical protein A3737_10595 [Oleiphilus sp. HI0065]KZY82869.1 hypothetical protein A3742_08300 [Oleiphilus sp. HI0071]KZY93111.1 hypothetical protein A3744_18375 [Oleiphilus sp. HI0073]KZZ44867.1 hypothetical protein A3758_02665 [Oleiphilus sp. HI0118]KZZ49175.1 hypothetical protein A3760_03005 [Oleiphilus sp. HI0122]KZZ70301.1 hypothetical protein A3765_03215 [Oleiphilus sp. HI0130]KZZ80255.1 hypotheti